MIQPTVGRVVWYNDDKAPYPKLGPQPFAAHVAFVHSDRLVNLLVVSHTGHTFDRENVVLLQEGDAAPAGTPYAEWMPFQKGQAAKTEAAEAANKPAPEPVNQAAGQPQAPAGTQPGQAAATQQAPT